MNGRKQEHQSARRRLIVGGAVQGVGFRPFVYRLATEMGLGGWVINSPQGALIEVEAEAPFLDVFVSRLQSELPAHAAIDRLEAESIPPLGETGFAIHHSDQVGAKTARILPDLAICPDCLRELLDPNDRRYRYPFINCTHCGPRYTIIQDLPYDRARTTMRGFDLCPTCRVEYENPLDRRFHAQPVACPDCGPQLALWNAAGDTLATRDDALIAAGDAIRHGQIVAVKGLGGFHLLVDARDEATVVRLRQRKHRYEKPLAVMFPSLAMLEDYCVVDEMERDVITSSAAPIVILRQRQNDLAPSVAPSVAPDNPYLGAMLPYTPLHVLLLLELDFPVVATSGNLSGEPICIDEHDALARLGGVADLFLVHNRPIARPVDDSVVMICAGTTAILRRARGYAPTPVTLKGADQIVAVGAQQKNTVAVAHADQVFLSQHVGDLDHAAAFETFTRALDDLGRMYDLHPTTVACDLHPDYASTRYAEQMGLDVVRVQHHYAHVLSCMAEHDLAAPVLGIAWDGTGLGTDGTIWGGEFLRINQHDFERVATLRPFPLQGGDLAAREPRRCALGVLYAAFGREKAWEIARQRLDFSEAELNLLLSALDRGVNAPLTSSAGRLFDAVAALVGLKQRCSFEGQAAMLLEYAALEYAGSDAETEECYPFDITPVTVGEGGCGYILEWNAMIEAITDEDDVGQNDVRSVSAKFHNTLVAMMTTIATRVGLTNVALSGGCFQNRILLEKAVGGLRRAGFVPYWQQCIPPNDGGIALGQITAVVRAREQ